MRERFRRVKRIFERAVELEGEAREACLREACGDDRGLLDQLRPACQQGRMACVLILSPGSLVLHALAWDTS